MGVWRLWHCKAGELGDRRIGELWDWKIGKLGSRRIEVVWEFSNSDSVRLGNWGIGGLEDWGEVERLRNRGQWNLGIGRFEDWGLKEVVL